MQQIAINERELAKRWGISPKTLQRWRSEGRGPRYLKLSKRVTYPLDGVSHFDVWRDNVRISRMHARLFFGMLRRLPRLLMRRWR